jgi:division/cell wall cluster transcriptional repressor MraZ
VEIDRQGRLRVPPELARLASLGGDVVLLGVGDHLELWDRRTWESYLDEKQPRYDEIAESAFQAKTPAAEPHREAPSSDAPAHPR